MSDIDALLGFLDGQCRPGYRSLVTALVAERDKLADDLKWQQDLYEISCVTNSQLRERVAELEAPSKPIELALLAELEERKDIVPELEAASKPADRDLRERLVCAALTGAMTQEGWRSRDAMAAEVVATADAAIAAMRKGGEA